MRLLSLALVGVLAAIGCKARPTATQRGAPSASVTVPSPSGDAALEQCRARIAKLERTPVAPGAPLFEERRAEILGRARGEPLIWVREPAAAPDEALPDKARVARRALSHASPWKRVRAYRARFRAEPATLRSLALREGYVYSADPLEALALVTLLHVEDLFDAPEIWLERGSTRTRLVRATERRHAVYRDPDGRDAELLFGDRFALHEADLAVPLHRDLRALADAQGFDRTRIERLTADGMLAKLRLGGVWVRALVESRGAKLDLACLDAPRSARTRIAAWQRRDATHRRALARLHAAVTQGIADALPFDRPRGEDGEDYDGQMRSEWHWAYKTGRTAYRFQDDSYPVFDAGGRPRPPEVCVAFVVDSYERAAGTWFAPRAHKPERVLGTLDFAALGLTNRGGVMAFGQFAEAHHELFDYERVPDAQRVPFRDRARFFASLVEHADRFRSGDVVAIQGLKADGKIHQHALLVERTDPETGFPYGLADQMHVPRRRTWETIMGPAPLRSILYRARPEDVVWQKLAAAQSGDAQQG